MTPNPARPSKSAGTLRPGEQSPDLLDLAKELFERKDRCCRVTFFLMMKITQGYVLAGGQSRRMGHDKLFILVDGVPLLRWPLDVCRDRLIRCR